jgi:hypothetical protein
MRIYALAISYASLQGKDGNEHQTWYIERTIEELKKFLGATPDSHHIRAGMARTEAIPWMREV